MHPTQGPNFSGIFLHRIVAWPSGNSPAKNYEDPPRVRPYYELISLVIVGVRRRIRDINTNNNTMTLKSGLEVTQGH